MIVLRLIGRLARLWPSSPELSPRAVEHAAQMHIYPTERRQVRRLPVDRPEGV